MAQPTLEERYDQKIADRILEATAGAGGLPGAKRTCSMPK